MPTYELCKLLAQRGTLTKEQLDLFHNAKHLTDEQYAELLELIGG